ncbi:tail fiber protein [Pseudomonas otitidis]|uniref:phage tail protein n=1 Tax=Metapseudomonas otitidis TaxID=319939 RepID=UPI0024482D96|nr:MULTISPECIES: phage tail protein [Pseudomonas]MDH1106751.1 tail fiber protein [Pseudomonas otitidis]MDH1159341.1 tail fiber protein [Pseudomonas otitidis]MDH1163753.1 tail fiber protein [Pseudomonas otitidis]MDL5600839.1 phage tail protein [Bacillus subtilis]
MTQYKRPDETVFASGAKTGEVENFPDIARGWGVSFDQTNGIPPMEWFNALFKRNDEALRYLLQRGIAEWSVTEEYAPGAYVQEASKCWKARLINLGKRPSTSRSEWVECNFTSDELSQAYAALTHSHSFSELKDKPKTLGGYGITDAAPIQAPAFTGFPTAPTPPQGDSSTRLATTEFVQSSTTPVGAVMFFATETAPPGWLKANGDAVSRITYSKLFQMVGVSYGAGDGVNTFNLPDLRGEFLRGWDDGRGVDTGRLFGSAQAAEVGAHQHPMKYWVWKDGTGQGSHSYVKPYTQTTGGVSGLDAQGTGPNSGAENRPRNVALLACIKF